MQQHSMQHLQCEYATSMVGGAKHLNSGGKFSYESQSSEIHTMSTHRTTNRRCSNNQWPPSTSQHHMKINTAREAGDTFSKPMGRNRSSHTTPRLTLFSKRNNVQRDILCKRLLVVVNQSYYRK